MQKLDDHFLPNARQRDLPVVLAGQAGGHTDPGGTPVVVPAFAVPVELDPYPAVFVGMDFFAHGADHEGRLQTVDFGFMALVAGGRAPGDFSAQTGEAGLVFRRLALLGFVVVADAVAHVGDEKFVVASIAPDGSQVVVPGQGEAATGLGTVFVAFGGEMLGAGFEGFQPPQHQLLTVCRVLETIGAQVVIHFHGRLLALRVLGRGIDEAGMRCLEVETGGGVVGRGEPAVGREMPDAALIDTALALPGDLTVAVDRLGFPAVAAEDQGMTVGPVFVPVGPALRFPAAVQVIVIGFGILHGVGHRRIGTKLAGLPVVLGVGVEDVAALFFEGLAMKDEVVATLPEEGKPGPQDHLVVGETGIVLDEAEGEDVAVEVAERAILAPEFDGDHLAHDILQGDGRVV